MDFDETPEEAAFRAECRAFLSQHGKAKAPGSTQVTMSTLAEDELVHVKECRDWQRVKADAGWAGLTWPVEFGGRGLTGLHEGIFTEEESNFDVPAGMFAQAIGMLGPTIIVHGTDEQKEQFLAPILRGEQVWCQLFSEPNAGSDVAAAQLRARSDGDEWVLDGQKVWTSSADRAAYGMCICRTDPNVPKHGGLTMFIVPMHTSGITIRPLRQANGAAGFNEVFFDGVRLPDSARLGAQGSGWSVAISMLMNERVSLGASGNSLLTGSTEPVLAARSNHAADPDRLAGLWIAEEVLRLVALRVRTAAEIGRDPGPAGSITKLAGSDLVRRAAAEHVHMRGASATAWESGDGEAETVNGAFLMSPSFSIAGGTSEIQRNIIGERVLGLPREPEVDRDVPFRDVLQNRTPGRNRGDGSD